MSPVDVLPRMTRGKQQARGPHWISQGRVRIVSQGTSLQLTYRDHNPFFFSNRRSLAASASNQSRKVAIFGKAAVAFGQMIQ
jgi:hypothetical protein